MIYTVTFNPSLDYIVDVMAFTKKTDNELLIKIRKEFNKNMKTVLKAAKHIMTSNPNSGISLSVEN